MDEKLLARRPSMDQALLECVPSSSEYLAESRTSAPRPTSSGGPAGGQPHHIHVLIKLNYPYAKEEHQVEKWVD